MGKCLKHFFQFLFKTVTLFICMSKTPMNSLLDVEIVRANIEKYLQKQQYPVKYGSVSKNVNITPKQCRYMLRTFFEQHKIGKSHPRYVIGKSLYTI